VTTSFSLRKLRVPVCISTTYKKEEQVPSSGGTSFASSMVCSAPDTSSFRPTSPHWAKPNETHVAGLHSRFGFVQEKPQTVSSPLPISTAASIDPQHHHLHRPCLTCVRPAPPRLKGRGSGVSSSGSCRHGRDTRTQGDLPNSPSCGREQGMGGGPCCGRGTGNQATTGDRRQWLRGTGGGGGIIEAFWRETPLHTVFPL
jgi:hypothetical protein